MMTTAGQRHDIAQGAGRGPSSPCTLVKWTGDMDSINGFRIRNIYFLKFAIAGELLLMTTSNRHQTIP